MKLYAVYTNRPPDWRVIDQFAWDNGLQAMQKQIGFFGLFTMTRIFGQWRTKKLYDGSKKRERHIRYEFAVFRNGVECYTQEFSVSRDHEGFRSNLSWMKNSYQYYIRFIVEKVGVDRYFKPLTFAEFFRARPRSNFCGINEFWLNWSYPILLDRSKYGVLGMISNLVL